MPASHDCAAVADGEGATLDRQVVAALALDARADLVDVAARTDAPATTVQRRLRALEADGTVEGYAARLDYGALGYETALVRLAVDADAVAAVTDRLAERRSVVTVYEMCGRFNVLAVCRFADEASLNAALRDLVTDPDVAAADADVVREVVREGVPPTARDRGGDGR